MDSIDPKVREKAERLLAAAPTSRAAKAIRAILERGSVTTEDLLDLGYRHAPRAIQDVKDQALPVVKDMVKRPDGQRMARYRFPVESEVAAQRANGDRRLNIRKPFRRKLMEHYNETDTITGAKLPTTMLTVDHRVPFQIDGDAGLEEEDVSQFMLLDRSMQRVKAWACQHCPNITDALLDPKTCRRCFWAYPEDYDHIAMENIRRTDIVWRGADVPVHDRLKTEADRAGITMAELLLRLARRGA